MHSKSCTIEIMIKDEADEIIEEHFCPLKNKYRNNLESLQCSQLVFDHV